jgi:hypothetical protein
MTSGSSGIPRPPERTGSAAGIPLPPDVARPSAAPGTGSVASRKRSGRRWLRTIGIGVVSFAVVGFVVSRSRDDDGATLTELRVGDCIEALTDSTFTSVKTVDCADPHTAEVYETGTATTTIDVADGASDDAEVTRICRTDADPAVIRAVVGALGDTQNFASFLVEGTAHGRVACLLNTPSRTGSFLDQLLGSTPPTT